MPQPTIIPGIAELADYVGAQLGTTDWVEISQEQIDAFADATGDHQWIHVDRERARNDSPFESTVAHGYLTISLIPALLPQLLVVEKVAMVVNHGIEKARLPSPVPAGGRVRLSAEIKKVRAIPRRGALATINVTMEVEGARKPACTAEVVYAYFA